MTVRLTIIFLVLAHFRNNTLNKISSIDLLKFSIDCAYFSRLESHVCQVKLCYGVFDYTQHSAATVLD